MGVVRIVPAVVAVDAGPVEEVGVLDEEDLRSGGAVARDRAVQPGGLRPPADRDRQGRPAPFQGRRRFPHLAVQRQHYRRG